MKILILVLFLGATLSLSSCNKVKDAETGEAKVDSTQQTQNAVAVKLNKSDSKIIWKGFKPAGSHFGTINVTEGEFKIEGEKLMGGTFTFDMSTISVKDLKDKDKGKLEAHLSSEDFFDVKKYPTSTFTITKVTEETSDSLTHVIEGNLKIREVQKSITFPANVIISADGKEVATKARFKIDRTLWGVMYHSAKDDKMTDLEKKAKDKIISDDVEIEINFVSER